MTKLLVLGEGFPLHLVSEDTGVDEYADGGLFGELEEGGGKHCWLGIDCTAAAAAGTTAVVDVWDVGGVCLVRMDGRIVGKQKSLTLETVEWALGSLSLSLIFIYIIPGIGHGFLITLYTPKNEN